MQENNLVFICSPLRGDYIENQKRAKGYCREAIMAGYMPCQQSPNFRAFMSSNFRAYKYKKSSRSRMKVEK